MRKLIAMASLAMVFGVANQSALAGSKGYIIANWAPAMNNFDDSGCPQGKNAQPTDVMKYVLQKQGMTDAEIAKAIDGSTLNQDTYGHYMTMRGRKDGKPVNVYANPLTVDHLPVKLDQAKEAFGFNLDNKVEQMDYLDPLTQESGVDNRAARVFGCFDRTRGTREVPPNNWSYRWDHYSEGNSWLIEIKNNGARPLDLQNEDDVTVSFHRGMQVPFKNGSGYQRNMTYTIDPNSQLKTLTSFKGKIRNGVFLAEVTPQFRMVGSARIQPVYDFKSVHLRITFKPDGSIQGFMGGYLPINMIYFPFGSYGAMGEYIGAVDAIGLYAALQENADTDIDADPKTGTRTRISQTYQLEAVPAYLLEAAPAYLQRVSN